MAQRTMALCFLGLAMFSMMFANSSAQSGCTTTIISMASCLGYISGNSSTPSSSCCSALSSVVKNNPECLCYVLAGGASSFGVTVNNTKALEMPGACNVKTPDPSECNKVKAPTAAPAPKQSTTPASTTVSAPTTSETPATPSVSSITPTGSTSKATPSTTTTTESSGSVKSGAASMVFVAALASFSVFLI